MVTQSEIEKQIGIAKPVQVLPPMTKLLEDICAGMKALGTGLSGMHDEASRRALNGVLSMVNGEVKNRASTVKPEAKPVVTPPAAASAAPASPAK